MQGRYEIELTTGIYGTDRTDPSALSRIKVLMYLDFDSELDPKYKVDSQETKVSVERLDLSKLDLNVINIQGIALDEQSGPINLKNLISLRLRVLEGFDSLEEAHETLHREVSSAIIEFTEQVESNHKRRPQQFVKSAKQILHSDTVQMFNYKLLVVNSNILTNPIKTDGEESYTEYPFIRNTISRFEYDGFNTCYQVPMKARKQHERTNA